MRQQQEVTKLQGTNSVKYKLLSKGMFFIKKMRLNNKRCQQLMHFSHRKM